MEGDDQMVGVLPMHWEGTYNIVNPMRGQASHTVQGGAQNNGDRKSLAVMPDGYTGSRAHDLLEQLQAMS